MQSNHVRSNVVGDGDGRVGGGRAGTRDKEDKNVERERNRDEG